MHMQHCWQQRKQQRRGEGGAATGRRALCGCGSGGLCVQLRMLGSVGCHAGLSLVGAHFMCVYTVGWV